VKWLLRLDGEALQYILLFEATTGIEAKDCVVYEDTVIFIIPEGKIGRAMGRKGEKIKKLKIKIGRSIRIIEFSPNPEQFLLNFFKPYGARRAKIEQQGGKVFAVVEVPVGNKAKAIGLGAKNIKIARYVFNRYYKLDGIYIEAHVG